MFIKPSIMRFLCASKSHRAPFSTTGKSQHQVLLEVERKFLPTTASVAYLRSGGRSTFRKYETLGNKTVHDVYYDQDGVLFSKGIYIRRRNGKWEAKVRTHGDFINSAFLEVNGSQAVQEIIRKYLNVSTNDRLIEDLLSPCAEFVTERESWMLDGKFQVDIDTTDFGHMVGEVELTRYLQFDLDRSNIERKAAEEDTRRSMDMDISNFMKSHRQAFPTGRPVGKLSAYFQMFPKN